MRRSADEFDAYIATRTVDSLEVRVRSTRDRQLTLRLDGESDVHLSPRVAGQKNDGLQLLDNHRGVRALLQRYPNVRAFIAGHKNVPSRLVEGGVVHLLVPQLIQAPCAFDLVDVYDGGFVKSTVEIDEQHIAEITRQAYEAIWEERFGRAEDRNFTWTYGPS